LLPSSADQQPDAVLAWQFIKKYTLSLSMKTYPNDRTELQFSCRLAASANAWQAGEKVIEETTLSMSRTGLSLFSPRMKTLYEVAAAIFESSDPDTNIRQVHPGLNALPRDSPVYYRS
jgi:hypothetical protein